MPNNLLSKAGLEVYTTKPIENPNVSAIGNVTITPVSSSEEESTKTTKDSESEDDESKEDVVSTSGGSLEPENNFVLQNGETKIIDYVGELFSDTFEMDYKDISSNASISVPTKYYKLFYKGKKLALKKGWGSINWNKDNGTALLGFITELSWNKEKIDIKISGMEILMDASAEFEFTQTKRSVIVKEIIETSGLKAKVNVKGLVDDVIDFKTTSSNDEGGSGESTGSATIDEAVENAIRGITDPLAKAKAIDKAFKSHVIYDLYWNCDYPNDLDAAWKDGTLNCADGANILCAMFLKAGLSAVIIHVPEEYSEGYGHYIVKVTINGKDYFTDNAATSGNHTSRPFGEVFGQPIGSEVGTRISG